MKEHTIKNWFIERKYLSPDDMEFLRSNKFVLSGLPFKGLGTSIITTTDEEETLMRLYFGSDARILNTINVNSDTIKLFKKKVSNDDNNQT